MKNKHMLTFTFDGDWHSVMSYLAGIPGKQGVRKIDLTREEDEEWRVEVKGEIQKEKKKANSGAGLYDLNW
jgi:hypothetical protein